MSKGLNLEPRELPPEEAGELMDAKEVSQILWKGKKRARWVNENMGRECGRWAGNQYLYYRAHAESWIREYLEAQTVKRSSTE